MSLNIEEVAPAQSRASNGGFSPPARVASLLKTLMRNDDHENRPCSLSFTFDQVLERHRTEGEFLFFFVDDWQSQGLQDHQVMWGIGTKGLTTDVIREVPRLAGRYRYPLWPAQVMLKISTTPTITWKRASLKKIAYNMREVELIHDLLVLEFHAIRHAPLTMQQEEMDAFYQSNRTAVPEPAIATQVSDSGPEELIRRSGRTVRPPNQTAVVASAVASQAGSQVPTSASTQTAKSDGKSPPAVLPAPKTGQFLFPYQVSAPGKEPLIKGEKVFIVSGKLKEFTRKHKKMPEEFLKAVVRDLLGLDSAATKSYIGGLNGKKGITNTVPSDFLPALKAFFADSGMKETRISFLASQLVNRLRKD